ncbi:MAG: hypothetical protein SFZ02_03980 [bacterium]|nr:hypothetical protein [bacterium]
MWNWLQIWFKGYQTTFDSPYPIEQCGQILRDHERSNYWKYSLSNIFAGFGKEHKLFIDIYKESSSLHRFVIRKTLLHSNTGDFNIEMKGTLESIPNGTRISAMIRYNQWGWLLMTFGVGLGFIFSIFSIINNFSLYGVQHLAPFLLYPIQIIVLWFFIGRPIMQFIRYPYQLLSGELGISPDEMMPSRLNPFQREFNFYTKSSIASCIEKLELGTHHTHFQYTPLGMLSGKTTSENLFIAFQEVSPTKTYFWIEDDNLFSQIRFPLHLFGMLQTEDDGTRVMGFSQNKVAIVDIIPYVAVLGFLLFFNPILAGVIGAIGAIGATGYFMFDTNIRADYPAKKILGESTIKPLPKKMWQWLRLKYEFDFHSPYPVVDCANMLMDYSKSDNVIYTKHGLTHGKVIDNRLFITAYPDDDKYQFWIQSMNNGIFNAVEVTGTLHPEGYGTRVTGHSRSALISNGVVIVMVIASAVTFLFLLLLVLPIVVILGSIMYFLVLQRIDDLGSYPKQVLGAKSSRKRKLTDDAEFE